MNYVIATQFSRTPSARIESEGKFPGEKLREIITPMLKACIQKKEEFWIDLDGTAGYGTSFLEEVFGGLIRVEHIDYKDLRDWLKIKSDEEEELIEECWSYIEDAENAKD
ncbi:MAG: STAS-like domain-containing protein [bacterium]|nr:STAS-like domain-containing protein [Candidatus Limimorpha caballi]